MAGHSPLSLWQLLVGAHGGQGSRENTRGGKETRAEPPGGLTSPTGRDGPVVIGCVRMNGPSKEGGSSA